MGLTASSSSLFVLALGLFAAGCAATTDSGSADDPDDTAMALSNSKIQLPKNDPCRDVLAPLALGLADGSVGLDYAKSIAVSLTSKTDTRLYTVAITGDDSVNYEVTLDNDSASTCFVEGISINQKAKLGKDSRTA